MRRFLLVVAVALTAGLVFAGAGVTQEANLVINSTHFAPGQAIEVGFSAPADFANNAWVGIIPSGVPHGDEVVNDKHDISYEYLRGKTSGRLVFRAPQTAGDYDLRMHDSDDSGTEVSYVSFSVTGAPADAGASLKLEKTVFAPGETINVVFTAPAGYSSTAWVGVIPSNIPHGDESVNDNYDICYEYLRKATAGVLTFKAPQKAGNYDFRMNDSDSGGSEVASVSFTVSM